MMEIYNRKLTKWPIPFESVFVDTEFGKTHLLISGSKLTPPLFMIHGMAMTSAVWLPNIAAFAQNFCCYAVDLIGDYGKSELNDIRNYPRIGKDYSTWLEQVYAGLGINKAYLLGLSHGGFAAMNHAIFSPEQVKKLILLAPSGLDLTLKKVLPKIFYYLLFPTVKNREYLVDWFLGDNTDLRVDFSEQLNLGLQGRPKVPIPILVPGYKLRKIRMPLMVILGEDDVTINANRAAKRIEKFIPFSRTELIHGFGHVLNYESADQVNQLVLDFLKE